MSKSKQSRSSLEQGEYADVKEAVHRAQMAWNEYERIKRETAHLGRDPNTSRRVVNQHGILHSAVMDAFNFLRSQIRYQLPEFWNDIDVYRDPETGEILLEGMKSLERVRGETKVTTTVVENRHGPNGIEEKHEPVLLPPKACLRTIDLLRDAMVELGYTPPPKSRKQVSVMEAKPASEPEVEHD